MHPAREIRGNASSLLADRRIALGVTGSIAAVETVKLARELARHGAEVVPFASSAALAILHPNALEFATGHEPVTELTGQVEHLMGTKGEVDAVLMAPATANSVAKAALAIDDTPVTSLVSTSLGNVPVVVAPAMHEGMLEQERTQQHVEVLQDAGATIIDPDIEEGEAKMASIETITETMIRELGPGTFVGERVLVVNGSTIEQIDEMRVVTNQSTGRTGAALAREAYRLGADVDMWFGHGHVDLPATVPRDRFVTVQDLVDKAPDATDYDWVLVPAAISDFHGKPSDGKLPSEDEQVLELVPTPKVLPKLREELDDGQRLVGFKAEADIDEADLTEKATRFRKENRLEAVVANRLEDVGVDDTRVHLVTETATSPIEGSKQDVARSVLTKLREEVGS